MKSKIESTGNKMMSNVMSAVTSAENRMLYLVVGAVIVDWAKMIVAIKNNLPVPQRIIKKRNSFLHYK